MTGLEAIAARKAADLALASECAREHLSEDGRATVAEVAETLAGSLDWPGVRLMPWRLAGAQIRQRVKRVAREALDELARLGVCHPRRLGDYRTELTWVEGPDRASRVVVPDGWDERVAAVIAAEIRRRREEVGLYQRELAERVGCDRVHVARDEAGRHVIDVSRAAAYARAFGCSLRELLACVDEVQRELRLEEVA